MKSETFDLALLDIEMPKMGEQEMVKEIGKLDPQLPVLLVTDSHDWPDRELRAVTRPL